jgi:hypothetical protein
VRERFLYIFLDESGNLDFSSNGTRYFQFAGVIQERPFESYKLLSELRYDLIEAGRDIQGFHATEDRQDVRNRRLRDHTAILAFNAHRRIDRRKAEDATGVASGKPLLS